MTRRPLSMACLVLILLIYMGTRFTKASPPVFEQWEGETVTVTGRVYQKETVAGTGQEKKVLYLRLISIESEQHQTDGAGFQEQQNIICYLKSGQELPETGSTVRVQGKLKNFKAASNPGQFDAESYYHILKISFQLNQTEIQAKSEDYSRIKEKLYEVKAYFSGILDASLSETEASLMKTMLLGEKGADQEIRALYQRNGIAHILAISGLHISLLGMTLYQLLKRLGLPVWLACTLPAGVILCYGVMTGFSVSLLRAVIMFVIHMAARLLGRTYDLITAAFLAALLLLLDQPLYLYSSSFLFSFGCIFAIGFLVPALSREERKKGRRPGPVMTAFLSGAAMTMAGLPLQLYFFYQMPLYGTALNLLALPLMSLLLPGGILLLVFYRVALVRELTVLLISGILGVYEGLCRLAEKLPFHLLLPGKPGTGKILVYLACLLLAAAFRKRLSLPKKWGLVLCGALLLFWPGRKELTVTFLDVGQGDCVHIKTMEGNHYLVDGGSTSVSSVGTYRIIPYLKTEGASVVEAVFVTHPDEDHCNGIAELFQEGKEQGITVKRLYLPDIGESSRSAAYEKLVLTAEENGIRVGYISKGQALLEEGFSLYCLHPEKGYETEEANQFSTVLLLQFGNFQALLTGDVEGDGERRLLQSLYETAEGGAPGISFREGSLTVLKAAHHGSSGTTSREILALLGPAYTVISCGENNSYGHPHKELLERLEEQGTQVMITYETGALSFHTDGEKLWVDRFLED